VTTLCKSSFQEGYNYAFIEIYSVVGNIEHAEECGECRACGVVRQVIEDTVHQLAAWMDPEEFWVFVGIVESAKERREQAKLGGREKLNGLG